MDHQSITYQRTSSGEEETSFSTATYRGLLEIEEPESDSRMRTRALNYLRQNYMKVFKIMAILNFILFVVSASLFYFIFIFSSDTNRTFGSTTTIDSPKFNTSLTEDTIPENYMFILATTLTPNARESMPSFSTTTPIDFKENLQNSNIQQDRLHKDETFKNDALELQPHNMSDIPWYGKIRCARLHCNSSSCYPQAVDYLTMKYYTCCQCYNARFTFKRYEYDLLRNKVSLVFQVPEDISKTSAYDLARMPKLPGLEGGWNLLQESDTAWYFLYEDVEIPPPQD